MVSFKDEYAFLSNFYTLPEPIVLSDCSFKTVEHAYQALKCVKMEDFQHISTLETPGEAKKYGKTVEMIPGWDFVKHATMARLLETKFSHATLFNRLRMVEGVIVESNTWHDNYWGSCTCETCGDTGMNHLGILLTQIRDTRY